MIQISDEIYISKYCIHSIKKDIDCFEIFTTQGKYVVSEYSEYYWNVIKFLRCDIK